MLLTDVQELLVSGTVRPIVRKKAALALLRLLRKSTSDVEELLQPEVRPEPTAVSGASEPRFVLEPYVVVSAWLLH